MGDSATPLFEQVTIIGLGLIGGSLAALGMHSDLPVVRQSERFDRYRDAIAVLRDMDRVYECFCTRREVREAASAPHRDPDLPVDVLAHSNGGLIASYYLRYGPNDVLDQDVFTPWDEGAHRVRRVVMLGTPSLGAVSSLERLQQGFKVAFRVVPVEVLVTFATPFEALPHPEAKVVLSPEGHPIDFDIYDPDAWRVRRWSVFSPEVEARVLASAPDRRTGELQMAELQAYFVRHLARAKQLQLALGQPAPPTGTDVSVLGGDCTLTPGRAVLDRDPRNPRSERLVIRPGEVRHKVAGVDYERLLMVPGDGLVTRESQLGRGQFEGVGAGIEAFPAASSFFLCERHDQLSVNPYVQNNLLHFLLAP